MKMSVWESSFSRRIEEVRREEIKALADANLLKAYNEALFFVCNVVIAAVIFTSKVMMDETLTASDVFTVITLVNIVQFTMTKFFSLGIMGTSEVAVTVSRIEDFMKTKEVSENSASNLLNSSEDDFVVKLTDVTTYWDDDVSGTRAISNANLTVKKGTIKLVIGPVGGGKSALVSAIIGDHHPASGEVKVNGSLAYAAQQPFIVSATIKENVLFGKPLEPVWYDEVIKAVGLDVDLVELTQGDRTIVGDR